MRLCRLLDRHLPARVFHCCQLGDGSPTYTSRAFLVRILTQYSLLTAAVAATTGWHYKANTEGQKNSLTVRELLGFRSITITRF